MYRTSTIMTIDPGKSGTGYCIWNKHNFDNKILKLPMEQGILHNLNLQKQLRQFEQLLIKFSPMNVYIENASFMYSNARTQATANTGALVVLAEYIGQLLAICYKMGSATTLVTVATWKGTLSKEIVWHRVKKKLPTIEANSHAQDAIALGMYLQGFINQPYGNNK